MHLYVPKVSIITVAEMAAPEHGKVYQSEGYVTTSIKAVYPSASFFTARFNDNGFTVNADG